MLNIQVTTTQTPAPKPDPQKELGFGCSFTDHMFLMDYTRGQGWHDARIVPFANLSLSPATMVFHYAQAMFEGMKAYRAPDGRTLLFRPYMNAKRLKETCGRLCIPEIPEEDFVEAVSALVRLEQGWVPERAGCSLYIRPFVIATDSVLGVAASKTYLFCIILSPSGAYYKSGLNPVSIWIEEGYVRAVRGGIGNTKAGGNYACSLAAQERAHDAGCAQVLWLDGVERRYIEEVGAMNIFFLLNNRLVTPSLDCGSILAGVTRDSVLKLCREWGIPAEERRIAIDELVAGSRDGALTEAFGTGTAAVISPVGEMRYRGQSLKVGDGGIGPLSRRLYDGLTDIQFGRVPDTRGWTLAV